jgi:NADH:ubiquinone oxidoreductase subunit C
MDIREQLRERLGQSIIEWQEKSSRRIYFSVRKEDVFKAVEFLFKELGLRFSIASGVDTPAGFQILYHFSYDKTGEIFSLEAMIEDRAHPEIDSITPIFPGAEWIEREMWEMLGINFSGHPNLKRLLLADDWPEGKYPLRQDYES